VQQRHKQRIIGAVVIVALAVIFLPMLLRGPVEHSTLDMPMAIPERPAAPISGDAAGEPESSSVPAIDRIPVREPDAHDDGAAGAEQRRQQAREGDQESPPAPVAEPESAPAAPGAVDDQDDAGEPELANEQGAAATGLEGYAVQVGSFRSMDNAMGLRNRLRDQGFAAFVDESSAGGSAIYRLRVGPVTDRDQARELARKLRQNADLEGLVVTHP